MTPATTMRRWRDVRKNPRTFENSVAANQSRPIMTTKEATLTNTRRWLLAENWEKKGESSVLIMAYH